MTSMETVTIDADTGTNASREDAPTLTVEKVEIRKESKIVGAGTDSPDPLPQEYVISCETGADKTLFLANMQKRESISLQPDNVESSNKAMINDHVTNSTISNDAIGNTVPCNVANDSKIHEQTVVNLQVSNSVTENTDTAVQNVNNVSNGLEVVENMEISEQQLESGTLFTVGSVILDSADQECSRDMCGVRELNFGIKTNVNEGEIGANIQVKNNTFHGIDTTTNKEESEINYKSKDFEKADEGNESEKPRKPCYDILRDNSDINEDRRNDNDVESGKIEVKLAKVSVMFHQASQTDLEECIEDSDGLRFLSIPQKPMVTTPANVSKPAQVINGVSKTAAVGKSPLASPRTGVRTSLAPIVRPQPSVRPAYAAVSRFSSPASTTNQALSHMSLTTPRSCSSPRLVRSRTSTDVRPAGRGTSLRKLPTEPAAAALKSQRPTLVSRQVRNC
jgi:hypothetical protein